MKKMRNNQGVLGSIQSRSPDLSDYGGNHSILAHRHEAQLAVCVSLCRSVWDRNHSSITRISGCDLGFQPSFDVGRYRYTTTEKPLDCSDYEEARSGGSHERAT